MGADYLGVHQGQESGTSGGHRYEHSSDLHEHDAMSRINSLGEPAGM